MAMRIIGVGVILLSIYTFVQAGTIEAIYELMLGAVLYFGELVYERAR